MVRIVVLSTLLFLGACGHSQPKNVAAACDFLDDRDSWYRALERSYKKHGTPIPVQLAIIRQESAFKKNAKPGRKYVLGIIPWGRLSSAFGYAQVLDSTWDWYKKDTGRSGASRKNFKDAVDFVGWYTAISTRTLGIKPYDAYAHYLAYHEGHGGYKRGTYKSKANVRGYARKVAGYANEYAAQLNRCEDDLGGSWFWPF